MMKTKMIRLEMRASLVALTKRRRGSHVYPQRDTV